MSRDFRPPVPQPVTIEGPAGPLEARVDDPSPGATPSVVGVVCHPHPLYGGTLHNKVVHTLARALQERGAPTLRFNFRGVGQSAGRYDGGPGELDDAMAACRWAQRHWGCETLWLAGFSFGSAVCLEAADAVHPRALVTVAPPVGRIIVTPVRRPACPWLVVHGGHDELVDVAAVRDWVDGFDEPPTLKVLPSAEHFFHGQLRELRAAVVEFLGDVAG